MNNEFSLARPVAGVLVSILAGFGLAGCVGGSGGGGGGFVAQPVQTYDVSDGSSSGAVDVNGTSDGASSGGASSGGASSGGASSGASSGGADGGSSTSGSSGSSGGSSGSVDAGGPIDAGPCDPPTCCVNAAQCHDGNPCTDDSCTGGKCKNTAIAGCAGSKAPCSAVTGCATGVCDPASNACVACLESKHCGAGKLCRLGVCKAATACDSDVKCKATKQVCAKSEGVCVDCISDADCGDKKRCVAHGCLPKVACQSSKQCAKVCDTKAGVCVDCTSHADCGGGKMCDGQTGTCVAALCKASACGKGEHFACKPDGSGYNKAVPCVDNKLCTDDSCNSKSGCVYAPNTAGCDDNDKCTTSDKCSGGSCKPGGKLNCDDNNTCTSDSCSPASGCKHANLTSACNDGDKCTLEDTCSGGKCVGGAAKECGDGNVCTDDQCDKNSGACKYPHNTAACDDGDGCTSGDKCSAGACKSGGAKDCDDGNKCTTDTCDAKTGKCESKTKPDTCDDGNPCTTDGCQPKIGCAHPNAPDGTGCGAGTCGGGLCIAAAPALGTGFTCAIKSGGVRCWGRGSNYQLGNGKGVTYGVFDVPGVKETVQLVAGRQHVCARDKNGSVLCWGSDSYGSTGTGKYSVSVPTAPKGLGKMLGISAREVNTCTWDAAGTAWCFGRGSYGQIGNGTKLSSNKTPTKVSLTDKVQQVAVGYRHACAVVAGGKVFCWGYNYYNGVDGVSGSSVLKPVEVKGVSDVVQVGAGYYHSCALKKDGTVWCWGYNSSYQVAGKYVSGSKVKSPLQVVGVSNVKRIVVGHNTNCAMLMDGKVVCWGSNSSGVAATGTGSSSSTKPTEIPALKGTTAMTIDTQHGCAFLGAKLKCWGHNGEGQLGLGQKVGINKVTEVGAVQSVSLGESHACAVDSAGAGWCWGQGTSGQVGNGKSVNQTTPQKVATVAKFKSINAGYQASYGIDDKGQGWAWGRGSYGALGNGKSWSSQNKPGPIKNLAGVTKVVGGREFACALVGTKPSCWGRNSYGQIGDGSKTTRTSPTAVTAVTSAIDIAVGNYHTCTVASDGKAWCWGYNYRGQLGDGTTTHSLKAVQVKTLTDVASISAEDDNTCALLKSGKLYCWGSNSSRKLNPKASSSSSPLKEPFEMVGFGTPVDASVARYHVCVVAKDGSLSCQGSNSYGALMTGPPPWSHGNKPLKSPLTNVVAVQAGPYFSCAIKSDKSLSCAGRDSSGQLGTGMAWRLNPTTSTVY